jgi:cobalt/nickel transport system permease protein
MMLGHLTVAGAVEGVVSGLVTAWLQRSNPQLLAPFSGVAAETRSSVHRWAWIGLFALILITPIGLLAPGTAWGEWSRGELANLGLGYVPTGFDRWSSLWSAPLSGYDLPLLNNSAAGYWLSALLGVGLILAVGFGLMWVLRRLGGRTRIPA